MGEAALLSGSSVEKSASRRIRVIGRIHFLLMLPHGSLLFELAMAGQALLTLLLPYLLTFEG